MIGRAFSLDPASVTGWFRDYYQGLRVLLSYECSRLDVGWDIVRNTSRFVTAHYIGTIVRLLLNTPKLPRNSPCIYILRIVESKCQASRLPESRVVESKCQASRFHDLYGTGLHRSVPSCFAYNSIPFGTRAIGDVMEISDNSFIYGLTSLPRWRETGCAEKNDRYFDFEQFKLNTHIGISYNFCIRYVPWPLLNTLNPSH